jgi:hypothetical protein
VLPTPVCFRVSFQQQQPLLYQHSHGVNPRVDKPVDRSIPSLVRIGDHLHLTPIKGLNSSVLSSCFAIPRSFAASSSSLVMMQTFAVAFAAFSKRTTLLGFFRLSRG